MPKAIRNWIPPLVALGIVSLLGFATLDRRLGDAELAQLAGHYRFDAPILLPDPVGVLKTTRQVHPSLARISGWISTVGAGAALGDVDGDGSPNDLCLVDPRADTVTIMPVPGTGKRYEAFTLEPAPLRYAPQTMAPMGCLLADLNEDGWMDVVVYFWGRTPVAYLRVPPSEGSPTALTRAGFKAVELVDSQERWFTNAATLADFDGDGHPDLLFANYFADGSDILNAHGTGSEHLHDTKSKSFNGGRKHFLLWNASTSGADPSVRFQHVTPFSDPALDRGWTLAVAAADLDGDQLPEIYLANDFGPDRLLHNRSTPGHLEFAVLEGKRGFFTPKSAVLGQDSFKGMGVDFGDINGDGLLDIYVSNIAAPYSLQESHMLWVNSADPGAFARGEAPFTQAAERYGLAHSGWGWDAKIVDLNNDGVPEVLQATGFLKGRVNRWAELQALATSNDQIMSNPGFWPAFRPGDDLSGYQPNALFARAADGRFYTLSAALSLADPYVTRGVAVADVDGDGALDFVYANQWEPSVYVHNGCKDCGGFLGLRLLKGPLPPEQSTRVLSGRPGGVHLPPAIGASVRLRLPDGALRVGQIDGGNGHSGRRSPELHFGLGKLDPAARLEIRIDWRDGQGRPRSADLQIQPGWNTIVLGS